MLDLDTIRTRTEEVRAGCANRRIDADVDAVLRLAGGTNSPAGFPGPPTPTAPPSSRRPRP